MTRPDGPRNLLLLDLPPLEASSLHARLEIVRVRRKQSIAEPGGRQVHAWFPVSGALSELVTLADGSSVEVGLIGWEGVAGLPAVFGSGAVATWIVCQTGGLFLRVPAAVLAEEAERNPELHRRLHRYAQALLDQRAIAAACDRRHDVLARCARLILAVHDLGFGDELTQTHDFFALRLGVQRPTVTDALAQLQRRGAISYRRGRVTVIDRGLLEPLSCECHAAVRAAFERQFDWVASDRWRPALRRPRISFPAAS